MSAPQALRPPQAGTALTALILNRPCIMAVLRADVAFDIEAGTPRRGHAANEYLFIFYKSLRLALP